MSDAARVAGAPFWGPPFPVRVALDAPHYGKRFFIERFGPTYYSFDHKGVRFLVLDSIGITPDRNYEGRVDAAQLDWLKAELGGLKPGQPLIVVTHIPLVTALSCYEPHHPVTDNRLPPGKILSLLEPDEKSGIIPS
ncbi:metallophosphoesterase family protein [Novosphingobium rosa]|uniref:metallophosphoesterase family protein n=1 Tax=Novosphingobium rosa TaxID=76978 RepID=UPI00082BF2AE|nr:hypothetical protein [Novosphingobium rosa]